MPMQDFTTQPRNIWIGSKRQQRTLISALLTAGQVVSWSNLSATPYPGYVGIHDMRLLPRGTSSLYDSLPPFDQINRNKVLEMVVEMCKSGPMKEEDPRLDVFTKFISKHIDVLHGLINAGMKGTGTTLNGVPGPHLSSNPDFSAPMLDLLIRYGRFHAAVRMVHYLYKTGTVDSWGNTPLHHLALYRGAEHDNISFRYLSTFIDSITQCGVDINAKNRGGMTAMQLVVATHQQVAKEKNDARREQSANGNNDATSSERTDDDKFRAQIAAALLNNGAEAPFELGKVFADLRDGDIFEDGEQHGNLPTGGNLEGVPGSSKGTPIVDPLPSKISSSPCCSSAVSLVGDSAVYKASQNVTVAEVYQEPRAS